MSVPAEAATREVPFPMGSDARSSLSGWRVRPPNAEVYVLGPLSADREGAVCTRTDQGAGGLD